MLVWHFHGWSGRRRLGVPIYCFSLYFTVHLKLREVEIPRVQYYLGNILMFELLVPGTVLEEVVKSTTVNML